LSVVLYVLAAIVCLLGIFTSVSLANAAAIVPRATIAFQVPGLRPIWELLVSGLRTAGLVALGIALITSALMAACGLLLWRSATLSLRIQRIEAALAQADILPATAREAR
jgi:hypothetical protein